MFVDRRLLLSYRLPHRNQLPFLYPFPRLPRTKSDTSYRLWCFVEGDNTVFPVIASSTLLIDDLKDKIKEKKSNLLQRVDASILTLWKVQADVVDHDEVGDQIYASSGQYQLDVNDQRRLRITEALLKVWPEPPPHDQLHVFVSLPEVGSPAFNYAGGGDNPVDSGFVKEYEGIFIEVKEWGAFESPDIEENGIHIRSENWAPVPEFVAELELELDRKPCLDPDRRRHMTFSALSVTFDFWMHILGVSREGPSKTFHRRNLPSKAKANLRGLPGISRWEISCLLPLVNGNDIGRGHWEFP